MVSLARDRVRPWTDRARIVSVDGRAAWPIEDDSCDRVVATYVLDLLSPEAIAMFFGEAARVLRTDGVVAMTSLAPADRGAARLLSAAWMRLFSVDPRGRHLPRARRQLTHGVPCSRPGAAVDGSCAHRQCRRPLGMADRGPQL